MADPAGTHSDGAVQWGTQVLTIPTSTGAPYIANEITVDFKTSGFQSKNISGVVAREVMIEEPFTGTATLQLANNVVPLPNIGDKFVLVSLNAVSLNCKCSGFGIPFKQDGETLVSLEFKKQLN